MNKGFQCNVGIAVDEVPFTSLMTTSDLLRKNLNLGDSVILAFDPSHVHAL